MKAKDENMTVNNEFHLLGEKKIVVDVRSWPNFVTLEVHVDQGQLTPDQARAVAANLVRAADLSDRLDWDADAPDDDPLLVEVDDAK